MKKLALIIWAVLLVSLVFAVTSTLTSFDNQDNPFNITFVGSENHTYYLVFPLYVYVDNVSLNIVGYEKTP